MKMHHEEQGKSKMMLHSVEYVLATGKILGIFSDDVNRLHDKLKFEYPKAKLTIMEGYVKVEKEE
jgi:hypothetical protein